MDDRRLQLVELLDFRPDEGVIRLHDQRVVILSAAAMGLLRKELIDTLGAETARRLLMRFGFADGYHDAVSLRDRDDWSNALDGLRTGAVVHTLEQHIDTEREALRHFLSKPQPQWALERAQSKLELITRYREEHPFNPDQCPPTPCLSDPGLAAQQGAAADEPQRAPIDP